MKQVGKFKLYPLDEVLDEAYKVVEKENDSREKIKNGATMEEIYSNGGAL